MLYAFALAVTHVAEARLLAAAANGLAATLAAFPTVTVEQTARARTLPVGGDPFAAAPADPDRTSWVRVCRDGDRRLYETLADPHTARLLARPPVVRRGEKAYGPGMAFDFGVVLTDGTRRLFTIPEMPRAVVQVGVRDPAARNADVLVALDELKAGRFADQALGGRLPFTCRRDGERVIAAYRFPAGQRLTVAYRPDWGWLPDRVVWTRAEPPVTTAEARLTAVHRLPDGRTYPARLVHAIHLRHPPGRPPAPILVKEYEVQSVATAPPTVAALQASLPAGTTVELDYRTDARIILATARAIGPDDLADLAAQAAVQATLDPATRQAEEQAVRDDLDAGRRRAVETAADRTDRAAAAAPGRMAAAVAAGAAILVGLAVLSRKRRA